MLSVLAGVVDDYRRCLARCAATVVRLAQAGEQ
jgi:hypothetical protein